MEEGYKVPEAALAGSNRPDLTPISVSRLGTFAKCHALGFLRYKLKAKPDYEAHYFMIGKIMHRAFELYYTYKADSPMHGAKLALAEEFGKHGSLSLLEQVMEIRDKERSIMKRFEAGEFLKPDGTRYTSPRMTKVYKDLVVKEGIKASMDEISRMPFGNVKLPEDGGLVTVVDRILYLVERYQRKLLIPREHFDVILTEQKFDFVTVTPQGKEVRFLGYIDFIGKLSLQHGGYWHLLDYKSSKAQTPEDHQEGADSSQQLTLYDMALDEMGIPRDGRLMSLHYPDAGYSADTKRTPVAHTAFLNSVDSYFGMPEAPMVKRLYYDGMDCKGCDLRASCVKTFGNGSCPMTVGYVAFEEAPGSTTPEAEVEFVW